MAVVVERERTDAEEDLALLGDVELDRIEALTRLVLHIPPVRTANRESSNQQQVRHRLILRGCGLSPSPEADLHSAGERRVVELDHDDRRTDGYVVDHLRRQ